MKAALLPEIGVVKVVGTDARKLLDGLVTTAIATMSPATPRFAALLSPQGKIVVDFIVVEAAPPDGGGFFLDVPRALVPVLVDKLNHYKLRAKVSVEDLSTGLGVMAAWEGHGETEYGLCYPDPRLPALGSRVMLPPGLAAQAATDLGATLVDAEDYEAHRIALGVPRGGVDFSYGDAFPHEADMDQLAGVDFAKGCFIGQEVVSRMEHRGTARNRVIPVVYDGPAPSGGALVMAGDRSVGVMGSAALGHGLAKLRLDRVDEARETATPLLAGGIVLHPVKPGWAKFPFPGDRKAE